MLATVTDFLWSYVLVAVLVTMGLIFTLGSRFVQLRYFVEMFRVLGGRLPASSGPGILVPGADPERGRTGWCRQYRRGRGGDHAGWTRGDFLDVGGWPDRHGDQLLRMLRWPRPTRPSTPRRRPSAVVRCITSNAVWAAADWGWLLPWLLLVTFGLAFVALQSFTASSSLEEAFGVPTHITGIVLTLVIAVTIFGGVQRISRVTEIIVPIMAILYVLVALYVVATNIGQVPDVLTLIVRGAFGLEQAVGGGIGAAIMMGVRRGLFSNEAGLGSAPNVAAVATVPHPVHQGIVQSFSVLQRYRDHLHGDRVHHSDVRLAWTAAISTTVLS